MIKAWVGCQKFEKTAKRNNHNDNKSIINNRKILLLRTSFITCLIQIDDSEFSKLPRRYQNQQIIWKRENKIYAMMPRKDSKLDSDWINNWINQ